MLHWFQYGETKGGHFRFRERLFKLLSNSVYGKSMENIRKRVNVRLFNDGRKLKKAIAKPTCEHFTKINEDLAMVQFMRKKIIQNKPLSIYRFCSTGTLQSLDVRFSLQSHSTSLWCRTGEASIYRYRQPLLQNSDRWFVSRHDGEYSVLWHQCVPKIPSTLQFHQCKSHLKIQRRDTLRSSRRICRTAG